ncbi:MAG: DUF4124 domain-containing protein [Pedobacter sp.]|nr:DUF4124 domain-containing protein [Pedobacter sp.]
MQRKLVEMAVLVVVILLATSWYYRARLQEFVSPPASAAHPSANPDVLYTWVDESGVTQFSAEAGKGRQRVEFDGSSITPIDPVESRLLARLDEVAADDKPKGSALIHDMRADIEQNRQKIEKAKMAAAGLE